MLIDDSSMVKFLIRPFLDFSTMASIAEYAYIRPKKSMRGANSVSLIEVDKNNVINPLRKMAIKNKAFKRFEEDFCFIVVSRAKMVMLKVISLYFKLINGRVANSCFIISFNTSKNLLPHWLIGVVCRL